MVIQADVTFFEVSPEIVFNQRKGQMIRLAYHVDNVPHEILNSDVVKYFDFREEIIFRMEWKDFVDGEWVLLNSRDVTVYPTERFQLKENNLRRAKCFLSKEELVWERSIYAAAEILCRVSLHPVLSVTRVSIPAEAGKTYKLIAQTRGDEKEYDDAEGGFEY